MLEHQRSEPEAPSRTVVLGAGFVGGAVVGKLESEGVDVLRLNTSDLDLLDGDARERLAEILRPSDALVFVSARVPCKTVSGLVENVRMAETVSATLERVMVDHIVYVSSDAVYADDENPVTEQSPAMPSSLHGAMHAAREAMLRAAAGSPLCILRPSLLYGADDPHNGYGPNRFRRLAAEGGKIVLFGNGEEKRDHVFVGDLAEIVRLCLFRRSEGVLNVATGRSHSFREVAELVVRNSGSPATIEPTERQNPITHRHFDITHTMRAFPFFSYTNLEEGLAFVASEKT